MTRRPRARCSRWHPTPRKRPQHEYCRRCPTTHERARGHTDIAGKGHFRASWSRQAPPVNTGSDRAAHNCNAKNRPQCSSALQRATTHNLYSVKWESERGEKGMSKTRGSFNRLLHPLLTTGYCLWYDIGTMTITFCTGKGGTGKTSMAVMTAATLADAGRAVRLVDLDPQCTATKWIEQTQPPGVTLATSPPDCITITDTPPKLDAPGVMDAIRKADVVAIVCTPSPVDVWTARETVQEVKRTARKGARVRLVFNMVQAGTLLAADMSATATVIGAPSFKTAIARRACYQYAGLYGIRALTAPARQELLRLALEIVA